ncbi:MAG: histidinol dehydrogenase [Buchnera aphidicola (Nurudea yanoniella)]
MWNDLEIFNWNNYDVEDKKKILSRPVLNNHNFIKDQVQKIIFDVQNLGDQALYNYTNIFDKINLNKIKVSKKNIINSELYISKKVKKAIKVAFKNIKKFHILQNIKNINLKINKNIICQHIIRPIESVGLYVPGGSAPLVSTVLMLAIPASISGCKRIVLCSPPFITNEILYVSKLCGIQEIFQIGGAQAIAALGCGTETISKVDKIFGPGNAYVTEAKNQISKMFYNVSIDMLAGPSEVLIIADDQANCDFIASDLLSQAEHDNFSQVLLVTYNEELAQKVLNAIRKQIKSLSRYEIIVKALKNSKIIITKDLHQCFEVSNLYAPEHLMIQCKNSQNFLKYIINAGSIFLGSWSPVAVGDYATGTNHVLPTYGSSNVCSGLSLIDFQKRISIQKLNKQGLQDISSTVISLSTVEKLDAHRNSVKIRLSLDKL